MRLRQIPDLNYRVLKQLRRASSLLREHVGAGALDYQCTYGRRDPTFLNCLHRTPSREHVQLLNHRVVGRICAHTRPAY